MALSKLKKLEQALNKAIPEGKALSLGEDIFLTGLLAGEDKVYGFFKKDGELKVVTREAADGFPVSDMDRADIDFIFFSFPPTVFTKIQKEEYEIVEADEM